mgnify:CR=1 FL=1
MNNQIKKGFININDFDLLRADKNGDLHLLTPFFLNNLNLSNQSQYLKLNFATKKGGYAKNVSNSNAILNEKIIQLINKLNILKYL